MLDHACGTGQHPHADRGNDLYQTPPEATLALLGVVDLPRSIWEPACGPGSIARTLRAHGHEVLATDLVDYASPDQDGGNVDFLAPIDADTDPAIADFCPEAIVTNPPYKLAAQFVRRGLICAPMVVMLLRLAFLESTARNDILDGGELAEVHVFRNRLPMMHREGWSGPRASSAVAFAWFVWRRGYRGATTIQRVSWVRAARA